MTFDREHGVLTWGGTLPGGESWSNTMRMAETEETVGANDAAGWDMEELLGHYSTVINAYHGNAGIGIHTLCKLTYVKFNRVDVNGHYIDPTTYRADFAPVSGGLATVQYPNQITLAVTLTTAISRGKASKGRIFQPMPAYGLAADGMLSVGSVTNVKEQWKAFIEALSDVPGVDTSSSPGACVMSKVGSTGVRTHRISGVKVGRVYDTQRRRRRNLPEAYEAIVVDQGAF